MKKLLLKLVACQLFIASIVTVSAQPLEPFEGCPGVSVAITRPGFNANPGPFQIYIIDDSTGAVQPAGNPIDLQINGFGLNNADGFLYGIHESFNVADPFLTRVDKNGNFENVGRIVVPDLGSYKVGLINTAAGTMDDKDNYYFTALLVNLQNIMLPPELYLGKIEKISGLRESNRSLNVQYKKIEPGTCIDELLAILLNPLNGVLQDIALNPADGNIYTYLPGTGGTGGKIAWFSSTGNPVFNCIDPPQPNLPTAELSGLFFSRDSTLFILTTDGNFYSADITAGSISLVGQSTLPLLSNNLRGDMASCVGRQNLAPFEGCPGLALAITRTGLNNTGGPFHIYKVDPSGGIQPVGNDINLQINAFGLNNKDGFLYGMHEVSNVFGPSLSRVDSNGSYIDLGVLTPPSAGGNRVGIINTAAATMDGWDNYYFTAIVADTQQVFSIPRLYLGTIKNVSKLKEGEPIHIKYERIYIGNCIDEIIQALSNLSGGILQDMAFNPRNGRIYTYIQTGASPAPGKLAYFRQVGRSLVLTCVNPASPNIATQDLSGMHADSEGNLFILTIDGKYYTANPVNGVITEVAQTGLPLLSNNLRGDMASCVPKSKNGNHGRDDDGSSWDEDPGVAMQAGMWIAPNPVEGNELSLNVHSLEQSDVELRIIDANGKLIQTRKISLARGENQFKVQLIRPGKGMYAAVLVYPSGRTSTSKFIRM